MVTVMETGDITDAFDLFQTLVVFYSQVCYVEMCHIGENDS
jgi:hypothetical protein